jgi:hypothetical protein
MKCRQYLGLKRSKYSSYTSWENCSCLLFWLLVTLLLSLGIFKITSLITSLEKGERGKGRRGKQLRISFFNFSLQIFEIFLKRGKGKI